MGVRQGRHNCVILFVLDIRYVLSSTQRSIAHEEIVRRIILNVTLVDRSKQVWARRKGKMVKGGNLRKES